MDCPDLNDLLVVSGVDCHFEQTAKVKSVGGFSSPQLVLKFKASFDPPNLDAYDITCVPNLSKFKKMEVRQLANERV